MKSRLDGAVDPVLAAAVVANLFDREYALFWARD